MKRIGSGVFAVAGVALLTAACATPPVELERARTSYEAVSADASVSGTASVELYEAGKSLDRAESAWNIRRDKEESQHLAYVTEQQIHIARAAARRKNAEAEVERLSQERQRILLAARSREAETHRARAEQRALEAEAKAREALLARQEADRAAAEAERRAREAEAARKEAEAARAQVAQLQREIEELGAKQTDRGIVLTLGDVLFDLNRAELRPGAKRNLEKLVQFLREHPDRAALIEGHTDSTGEESYNLDLSERRARSVRLFLLENGIGPKRLLPKGFGESYPVSSNATQVGRQQNRRVEVVILEPGQSPDEMQRTAPVSSR